MSQALSLRNEHEDLPSQEIAHAIAGTMEQLRAIRTFIKAEFQIGHKDAKGNIVKGTDAGLIPGCGDKPTLFLPGAQKATMYFNCFPTYKVQERDLGNGHVTFRVRCLLISRATRDQVGEGVGCCSTMEKKYRWRGNSILCPTCGKPAIFKSKDKPEFYCWKKKEGCGATFALNNAAIKSQGDGSPVENPDLYDVHNTVLKMAKKRAHVDAAMTLACLSELFTQDIEDTYAPDQVREAAQPYEGEVVEEHNPSASQKSAPGLFTKPQVKLTQAFNTWMSHQCDRINQIWQSEWDARLQRFQADGLAVPEKIHDVINPWQAKGHLLKWAVKGGHLDDSIVPENAKTRQADAYVALVFHRSPEGKQAIIAEMGEYLDKQRALTTGAIFAKHPDLAPDGFFEELAESPDRGDAHEGSEAYMDAALDEEAGVD